MAEHAELTRKHKAATERFRKFIKRNPDGTFALLIRDPREAEIDPVEFADLARSLDETNRMIRAGLLDPKHVEL